MIQLYVILARW